MVDGASRPHEPFNRPPAGLASHTAQVFQNVPEQVALVLVARGPWLITPFFLVYRAIEFHDVNLSSDICDIITSQSNRLPNPKISY